MPDYTPTFADVCSAIADGGVIATLEGSVYSVSAFELKRYFNRPRALPGISLVNPTLSDEYADTQAAHPSAPVQKH